MKTGPPNNEGRILLDGMPYGKLVVASHYLSEGATHPKYKEKWATGGTISGENMKVRAQTPTKEIKSQKPYGSIIEGLGQRKLVCKWLPGPAFSKTFQIEMGVVVKSSVSLFAKVGGKTKLRQVDASSTIELSCDIFGQKKNFEGAIQLKDPVFNEMSNKTLFDTSERSVDRTVSRNWNFETTAREKLNAHKLRTKTFATNSNSSIKVVSNTIEIVSESSLSFSCVWNFRAKIYETRNSIDQIVAVIP
jgi:hypothetical protein